MRKGGGKLINFSAVSSTGRENVGNMGRARSLGGWRVAAMALFGQMWVSAMRKTGCVFTFCILCFVFALKWKSLLYSIPHFCAFVKLKCDFNSFVRFFLKKTVVFTVARGPAVGETSRSRHKNAPVTVARGPVPRDRSTTVSRGPVPRDAPSCLNQDSQDSRICRMLSRAAAKSLLTKNGYSGPLGPACL